MIRFWKLSVLVLSCSVSIPQIAAVQSPGSPEASSAEQKLKLITIGQRVMSTGRYGAFRIYEAPDGTRATVSYATFESLRDAKRQIREWLKLVKRVTHRDRKKDQRGQAIMERIVGIARDEVVTREEGSPKGDVFLIVERKGLNCYFIDSMSLPVATQVEKLIED